MAGAQSAGSDGRGAVRWKGKAWEGSGVWPNGNRKSQKTLMLKADLTTLVSPKDNSDYTKENGLQGPRADLRRPFRF